MNQTEIKQLRKLKGDLPTEPSIGPSWGRWASNSTEAMAAVAGKHKFDAKFLRAHATGLVSGSRKRYVVRLKTSAMKALT